MAMNNDNQDFKKTVDLVFTASQTSADVWIKGGTVVGILFTGAISTDTTMSFTMSVDDTTYYPVLGSTVTVAGSSYCPIDPVPMSGVSRLKGVFPATSQTLTAKLVIQPVM